LILGFDRGKGGGSQPVVQIQTPVEILRTLILPNNGGGDPFKFELDAVVIRKSWGHYESAIKCSDSDKWLYNKISSSGETQLLEQYESFEYMANTKALEKNLILSFYSKVPL
jgi:ubiquitin C-terminal hydrolase